ncbi:MAG TPA: transcriptional regulator [Candidatus Syntrophosphaera sp.]|nr:transcriptional regulator [Candidatus Syntrophosphaera sp.]
MPYEDHLRQISELDPLIHNPARLMIIFLLARSKNMDYTTLMQETGLTSGNITTHLNKLLQSGYIDMRKSFVGRKPNTTVQITKQGLEAYRKWGARVLWSLPDSQIVLLKPEAGDAESDTAGFADSLLPEIRHLVADEAAGVAPFSGPATGGHQVLPGKFDPAFHLGGEIPARRYHEVLVEPVPEHRPVPQQLRPGYQPIQVWSYASLKHNPNALSEYFFLQPESQAIKVLQEFYLTGHFLPVCCEASH